eukprot:4605367-Amphidinium_carterae.2
MDWNTLGGRSNPMALSRTNTLEIVFQKADMSKDLEHHGKDIIPGKHTDWLHTATTMDWLHAASG